MHVQGPPPDPLNQKAKLQEALQMMLVHKEVGEALPQANLEFAPLHRTPWDAVFGAASSPHSPQGLSDELAPQIGGSDMQSPPGGLTALPGG